MAYKILEDKCKGCGDCAAVCPGSDIPVITKNGEKYSIDPETCYNCGACESACEHKAIVEE